MHLSGSGNHRRLDAKPWVWNLKYRCCAVCARLNLKLQRNYKNVTSNFCKPFLTDYLHFVDSSENASEACLLLCPSILQCVFQGHCLTASGSPMAEPYFQTPSDHSTPRPHRITEWQTASFSAWCPCWWSGRSGLPQSQGPQGRSTGHA